MAETLPIFPLQTVLFPDGVLPLRIFEPRYLDMVADCLRNDSGFGVCLLRSGREAGPAAPCHATGTVAMIEDWEQGEEGLLHITVRGRQRFRLLQSRVRPDQLTLGEVEWLEFEPAAPVPAGARLLPGLLGRLIEELGPPFDRLELRDNDLGWVTARLTEILPLALPTKQQWLEAADPQQRAEGLLEFLRSQK
ncbi:LON peptidase substrate-binding domain-containing protein [Thiohalobacter thiocyanaticus]|uniref:Peptidase S16 n=1 Tax=Thiohalobacter thiocyanaticus TaxID=585455 RepID=A0A426QI87_9GAMM|nr:LON peptidase substrate-binding domain-containing protein [Thiohalobacter thiocyanaticus]RRQ21474.1 peptidase S16 [Thiohalobacter thiocyanaticus]